MSVADHAPGLDPNVVPVCCELPPRPLDVKRKQVMSEREGIRQRLSADHERREAAARETADRIREGAERTQAKIDEIGDAGLSDYERRRARLEFDVTADLPDDSAERR